MVEIFDVLFDSIQVDHDLNLGKKHSLGRFKDTVTLKESQTVPFEFHLNKEGEYIRAFNYTGFGKTIDITTEITAPKGVYEVTIISSAGGGGTWKNVKINDAIYCKINTNRFGTTALSIQIKSSVSNKYGEGKFTYRY